MRDTHIYKVEINESNILFSNNTNTMKKSFGCFMQVFFYKSFLFRTMRTIKDLINSKNRKKSSCKDEILNVLVKRKRTLRLIDD